ncbi:LPXTG cell wall anchor domain-containing protein [Enterococcus sp. LJL90]
MGSAMYVQANAGGQVVNDGEITFYDESTPSSTSEPTSTSLSAATPISSSSGTLPSTGGGKLPQTGETIRNFSFMGGGVLLVVLSFLLYRRKKDKEGDA